MDTQNKKFNPIIILVLLVVGFFVYMMLRPTSVVTDNRKPTDVTTEPAQTSTTTEPAETMEPTQPADTTTKEFELEASNFSFSVAEIKVKKGDTVKITLVNKDGFHDWNLDEFSAKTKVVSAGGTDTVEFVADKVGTFEYYCSVAQHRANGMVGNLIVE